MSKNFGVTVLGQYMRVEKRKVNARTSSKPIRNTIEIVVARFVVFSNVENVDVVRIVQEKFCWTLSLG